MNSLHSISRRHFCQVSALAAGGLLVSVRLVGGTGRPRGPESPPFAPNAFIRVDRSGQVTVIVARPELGQGVRTSLPMLVAEELDVDLAGIQIQQAEAADHAVYGDQYAGGSQSVRNGWEPLRHAGAVARALLVLAAARRWGVEPSSCDTVRGTVVHSASGRALSYGEVVTSAAELPVPTEVSLKDPHRYTIIGHPTCQLDAPAIVRGAALFGLDVRVPAMRFASIERAPAFGARIAAVDDTAARAIPGVRAVVRIDADALRGFGDDNPRPANGVAVVADSTWLALKARHALHVTWSESVSTDDTERLRAQCRQLAVLPAERIVRNDGDVDRAMASASRTLEAVYELPLVAHAPMEPMNCVADVRPDRCEVWAPTQNPLAARRVAAAVCGLPLQSVTVHVMRSGGGFGRRFYSDFVAEAVVVSREARVPVQVVWTREDDTRHDFFRPASYHVMRGAIDASGAVVAWSQHLVNAQRGDFLEWPPPRGASVLPAGDELGPFDFPAGYLPNLRLMGTAIRSSRVPLGQWRSVEDSTNVFVYQSFIDELADLAGRDPLAYRLEVIGLARALPYYSRTYDVGRLRNVLESAAREAQWGTPMPARSGRGIAVSYANSAYVAVVAEIEIGAQHEIRARRLVVVADIGTVVNPLGAAAQVEGAAVFGLSAALKSEITIASGRVTQGNFDDFPVIRMSEAPRIEVHFMPSTGAPLGCGETAVPPVAPAVTNAIFAATGTRIRRLPIRASDFAKS